MQIEKLRVSVDATIDTYKVVPDSLLEALNDQNIALAREEAKVERFAIKNPIFAEIIHYTNKIIQFLNLTINCRSSIKSRKKQSLIL